MQSRDITEILKVFEKRITKLEKRVGDLESVVDDWSVGKASNDHAPKETENKERIKQKGNIEQDDAVHFKTLDSRFDELSIESRPLQKKVTYDKNFLLSIRPTSSLDSQLTAHTDIEHSISVDALEEGEVYEPSVCLSPPVVYARPLSFVSSKEPRDQIEPKADNRRRHPRDKKAQSPRNTSTNSSKQGGRDRAKSEPIGAALKYTRDADKIVLPDCKTEMHYGLMVQYPPEDK